MLKREQVASPRPGFGRFKVGRGRAACEGRVNGACHVTLLLMWWGPVHYVLDDVASTGTLRSG